MPKESYLKAAYTVMYKHLRL